MKNLENLTEALVRQEIVEIETKTGDLLELSFNSKTNNFAVWLNGKIIDTKKTFKGIVFSAQLLNCKHSLGL